MMRKTDASICITLFKDQITHGMTMAASVWFSCAGRGTPLLVTGVVSAPFPVPAIAVAAPLSVCLLSVVSCGGDLDSGRVEIEVLLK